MLEVSCCWITRCREIRGEFLRKIVVLEGQLYRLSP